MQPERAQLIPCVTAYRTTLSLPHACGWSGGHDEMGVLRRSASLFNLFGVFAVVVVAALLPVLGPSFHISLTQTSRLA